MKSLNSNYVLEANIYIWGNTCCLHLKVTVRRDNKQKYKGTLRWCVNGYPDAVGTVRITRQWRKFLGYFHTSENVERRARWLQRYSFLLVFWRWPIRNSGRQHYPSHSFSLFSSDLPRKFLNRTLILGHSNLFLSHSLSSKCIHHPIASRCTVWVTESVIKQGN